MRKQISSKSDTCTESMVVYAAGISVKVGAHYPGRSVNLPCATGIVRCRDGLAEVSRPTINRREKARGNALVSFELVMEMDDLSEYFSTAHHPGGTI